MKVGINLQLWLTHLTEQHLPLMHELKAMGYDGVEVPLFEGEEEHYAAMGRELRKIGLECTTSTAVVSPANPLSDDASQRTAAIDHIAWACRMSEALGSRMLIGPMATAFKVFTGVGPTDDEMKRCAGTMFAAAEHAKRHGVQLAVEYLNRFECYALNTAAQCAALVSEVDHPSFMMMYDTFHANLEEDNPVAALKQAMPHVVHVHVSENNRGIPGDGHVPFAETFRVLHEAGYDDWLTLEAFCPRVPQMAQALNIWRDYFDREQTLARKGLAFTRTTWHATK